MRWMFVVLLAATLPLSSLAFVPPKPGSDLESSYEFVDEYRAKRNMTFDYHPTHISPELCKHMTEEECEHADQSMALQHQHYDSHRRLRRLEPNAKFRLNILVLLVIFTDHQDRPLPEPYEYQLLLNLRVAKYLEVNSYNNMDVWFDVQPWAVTDNTELHYSFDKAGRTTQFQQAFHPILDELYASGMDFSPYDNNNDGIMDNLLVIHSGYPAEVGKTDCTNGRSAVQRIWAHALADTSNYNWVSSDGALQTNAYTVASGLYDVCGSIPAHSGVVTHEFFHAFAALPDLYDTSKNEEGRFILQGRGGVGSLDCMANPYGVSGDDEDFPTHLSAWTKLKLGWVVPEVVNGQPANSDNEITITLRPSESYPDVFRINLENFFGVEYLLLENRQRQWFDIKLFGTGLAIYHIDDGVEQQENRGYPGQDGWPENGNHYRVAVAQKDGRYDLEKAENRGDADDFYRVGDRLGPNEDGETYPNTDTYGVYSGVYPTGIIIEVVEQNGDDLVVKVTIPSSLQGAPMKESDAEFAAPVTMDTSDGLSGKFEASWFHSAPEKSTPQESGEVGVGSVEGRPGEDAATTNTGEGIGFVEEGPEDDTGITDSDSGVSPFEESGELFGSNQKEPSPDEEDDEEDDEDSVDSAPMKEEETSTPTGSKNTVGTIRENNGGTNSSTSLDTHEEEAVTSESATMGPESSGGTTLENNGDANDNADATPNIPEEEEMDELFPNLFVNSSASETNTDGGGQVNDKEVSSAPTDTSSSEELTLPPSPEPTAESTEEEDSLSPIEVLDQFPFSSGMGSASRLWGIALLVAFGILFAPWLG